MQRSLGDLKKEAKDLGLVCKGFSGRGGKEAKRDYVKILGDHFQEKEYGKNVPFGLAYMRSLESPMLAFRYGDLKESEQKRLFSSPVWVFEEKIDGCRMVLISDGKGGKWAYSRNLSVKNYLPVDYSEKISFPEFMNSRSVVLDTEVQCTKTEISMELAKRGIQASTQLDATTSILSLNTKESLQVQEQFPLRFIVFDLLYLDGIDCKEIHWFSRRERLDSLVPRSEYTDLFFVSEIFYNNRMEVLESILSRRGEGVIAKNINSVYTATNARGRNCWVKVKRSVSSTMGAFGGRDYVDAFVTGFEKGKVGSAWENLVGSLELSVTLNTPDGEELHKIARVSNIPMEDRVKMTGKNPATGEIILNEEYYGAVYEIDGQDVSSRSLRFSHAVIIRKREDKSGFDCIMDKEELLRMVM